MLDERLEIEKPYKCLSAYMFPKLFQLKIKFESTYQANASAKVSASTN